MTDHISLATIFFQFSKILVTLATVIALAWIAERVSTKMASVLAGFPLGTAIALFYLGAEQGDGFAAASARYTVLGFISALWLTATYLWGLRFRYSQWISPVAGLIAFILSNLILIPLSSGLWPNLLLAVSASICFAILYRKIPTTNIARSEPLTKSELVVRSLMSAVCILLITMLGFLGNSAIAGLFAAFPITFMPLLLVIHIHYGNTPVYTLIKYYPVGLGALISHTTVVALVYERLGIYLGTVAGIMAALAYLLLYTGIRDKLKKT